MYEYIYLKQSTRSWISLKKQKVVLEITTELYSWVQTTHYNSTPDYLNTQYSCLVKRTVYRELFVVVINHNKNNTKYNQWVYNIGSMMFKKINTFILNLYIHIDFRTQRTFVPYQMSVQNKSWFSNNYF